MVKGLEPNHPPREPLPLSFGYLTMRPGGQICLPDLALGYVRSSPSLQPKAAKKLCTWGGKSPFLSDGTGLKRKNEGGVPISVVSGNNEAEREIAHVRWEVPGPPTLFAHLLLPPEPHCAADSQL